MSEQELKKLEDKLWAAADKMLYQFQTINLLY